MRKFMMVLTLALTFLAVTGSASQITPPECGDDCPFVR
jgi:hypothetical protein